MVCRLSGVMHNDVSENSENPKLVCNNNIKKCFSKSNKKVFFTVSILN